MRASHSKTSHEMLSDDSIPTSFHSSMIPTHTAFELDLAISAVVYDTLLVVDVMTPLTSRLGAAPVWTGSPVIASRTDASPLDGDVSRVALVLAQRLWGQDPTTSADAQILADRARRDPNSIVAISLDGALLPAWMSDVRRHDLAKLGVDGIVAVVLEAIEEAGGQVKPPASKLATSVSEAAPRWPDPPTPFLAQPRAQGALRRELDLLVSELERRVDDDEAGVDKVLEVQTQPNRAVARVDDVGVSFSWVPGRSGSVADGQLMVIEWSGMVAGGRKGPATLQNASPIRERVYVAEARDPEHWCWRAEGPHGRASSTAHLVGEWIAGATMTARQLASA
jgi:hypothetical protein